MAGDERPDCDATGPVAVYDGRQPQVRPHGQRGERADLMIRVVRAEKNGVGPRRMLLGPSGAHTIAPKPIGRAACDYFQETWPIRAGISAIRQFPGEKGTE